MIKKLSRLGYLVSSKSITHSRGLSCKKTIA